MLVEWFTQWFDSQRVGFLPVGVLLAAGLVGLYFVRGGGRLEEDV